MSEMLQRAAEALKAQAVRDAGHPQSEGHVPVEDTQAWIDMVDLLAIIKRRGEPEKVTNMLCTQGYDADGKKVVYGARSSSDPRGDEHLMSGFLELEQAHRLRNVPIPKHKLGALWLSSVEPQPATAAARDVLAERQRQVEREGWTPEHDDAYADSQLAHAAAAYAYPKLHTVVRVWPWANSWFKPGQPRHNYVRAAALLLAEIERIDRATAKGAGRPS